MSRRFLARLQRVPFVSLFAFFVGLLLDVGTARAQSPEPTLVIRTEPAGCLLAERLSQVDACIEPESRVLEARVYFRARGSTKWHFVEMSPVGKCYRANLPPPALSTTAVEYYVDAVDVRSTQSRSDAFSAAVVADGSECRTGAVAPILSGGSVAVRGGGYPDGFLGRRGVSGKKVGLGAAVVGGGAALAAGVAGAAGGSGSDGTGGTGGTGATPDPPATTTTTRPAATTTTTTPPAPTTTTTTAPAAVPTTTTTTAPPTTTSPPTTTTTTTTAPPATTTTTVPATTTTTTQPASGCSADSGVPGVRITSPSDNQQIGSQIEIVVEATDPGPVSNGITEVRLTAREADNRQVSIATLRGAGPTFRTTWNLPACSDDRDDWTIRAEAVDGCGRTASTQVGVRRSPGSCKNGVAEFGRGRDRVTREPLEQSEAWTSELGVASAKGQVVLNGTEAAFVGSGRTSVAARARRGANRVEAVLVQGARPGTWRFSAAAGVRPGTLRVVAGDVASIDADEVTFRLQGRPGERVVFEYESDDAAAR